MPTQIRSLAQKLPYAVGQLKKKKKKKLPYDPTIPVLGIYLKNTKTLFQKDICTHMFITVLPTTAKIWKQLDE